MLSIFAAMFPSQRSIFGLSLEQDALVGTVNFLKASEGYLEAYPQSIYQIAIAMRDQWPPSMYIDSVNFKPSIMILYLMLCYNPLRQDM